MVISESLMASLFEDEPTSSVEALPVSRFLLPGSDEARTMTAGSGEKLCALLPKSSPLGSCLRTLLESREWASPEYLLNWRPLVTRCGCLVFQLAPSEPHTDATATGSWATPRAQDEYERRNMKTMVRIVQDGGDVTLPTQMKAAWATPRSASGGMTSAEHCDLPGQMKAVWPTPQSADETRGPEDPEEYMQGDHGRKLGSTMQLAAWPTPTSRDDKGQTQNPERSDYVPNIVKATWPTVRVSTMNGPSEAEIEAGNPKHRLETAAAGPATSGCLARTERFAVRLMILSAWLMGFPWSYLKDWPKAKSRKPRTGA